MQCCVKQSKTPWALACPLTAGSQLENRIPAPWCFNTEVARVSKMLVFGAGNVIESHGPKRFHDWIVLLDLDWMIFGSNNNLPSVHTDNPKQASPALIFNEAKPCQVRDLRRTGGRGRDGRDFQGFVDLKFRNLEICRCYYTWLVNCLFEWQLVTLKVCLNHWILKWSKVKTNCTHKRKSFLAHWNLDLVAKGGHSPIVLPEPLLAVLQQHAASLSLAFDHIIESPHLGQISHTSKTPYRFSHRASPAGSPQRSALSLNAKRNQNIVLVIFRKPVLYFYIISCSKFQHYSSGLHAEKTHLTQTCFQLRELGLDLFGRIVAARCIHQGSLKNIRNKLGGISSNAPALENYPKIIGTCWLSGWAMLKTRT